MRQFLGSLAIQRFDRTAALHDGRVRIEHMMVSHVLPAVGVQGLLTGVFEAAEIPLAHYAFLEDQGEPYTAIPVFPDRLVLQPYVLTRPDTGIRSLQDLAGRRVAVPMYYMTSSVWHRGILHDSTGIEAADISWVTTAPERDPRMAPPPGVKMELIAGPHLGVEPLLDGRVDALMTEGTPIVPTGLSGDVVTVHQDPHGAATEYFRQTGVHPIVHVIAMRTEFAEQCPELVVAMCEGFQRAKLASYRLVQNERMTGLPMMRLHLDETTALFGDDPWPYGIQGRNRAELDIFLEYARRQGLTRRRLSVDDLFDNISSDFDWSMTMTRGADLAGVESLLGLPD
jgi:4,5-dihydroxyphthalate decarboxylase